MRNRTTTLSLMASILISTSISAEYLGPTPYLSLDNTSADTSISPFANTTFESFFLEDFEDGALNTPGVTLREFATTNISTAFSDSVDGDDGVIDGFATGQTMSLFSNFATSSFTFDFSASALGGVLPTHAGIVWTDIGRNNGGTPFAGDLIDNTIFEAFDHLGNSLGVFGPFSFGDSSISRTTGEDRFLGVINLDGISAISISMPGKNNWEVDHLQYGIAPGPIPAVEECTLDADGNESVDALTDGLLFIRHMFGIRGVSLVEDAIASNCSFCVAAEIEPILDQCAATGTSDIDGNGNVDALTDGLLIIRFIFGIRGGALISDSVGDGCSRCTVFEIEDYIEGLIP